MNAWLCKRIHTWHYEYAITILTNLIKIECFPFMTIYKSIYKSTKYVNLEICTIYYIVYNMYYTLTSCNYGLF